MVRLRCISYLNMGRIAAIAGGSLSSTEALSRYAIGMTGKEVPNVLFVPTAHRDDAIYISDFKRTFEGYGTKVKVLELVKKQPSEREVNSLLEWADLIYVGGGNTIYMMNIWRQSGFDQKLKTVYNNDSAVLAGNGAGCLCWYTCGYSNSQYNDGGTDWQYIWADNLLDIHHTAVCPHYNDDGRSNFDRRLMEKEIPGYAMEDNVAMIQIGEHTEFIASHPKARAFYVIYLNGEMLRKEIKLKYI